MSSDSMQPIVVAVDGPAGSGKSSVSKAAAVTLGYAFLDTGAAYRALTWLVLKRGIAPTDTAAVLALLPTFHYTTEVVPAGTVVHVGDDDVTDAIREPRISAVVSDIARIPEVREALTEVFRRLIRATDRAGIVVEGRDITTVVAPDATSTASQLRERDRRDAQVVDFMTAAPGVTTIDSTDLDFDQTVDAVVRLVRNTTS